MLPCKEGEIFSSMLFGQKLGRSLLNRTSQEFQVYLKTSEYMEGCDFVFFRVSETVSCKRSWTTSTDSKVTLTGCKRDATNLPKNILRRSGRGNALKTADRSETLHCINTAQWSAAALMRSRPGSLKINFSRRWGGNTGKRATTRTPWGSITSRKRDAPSPRSRHRTRHAELTFLQ